MCTFGVGFRPAEACQTTKQPVTDSSAQASPVGPALKTPATDDSAQASPTSPDRKVGTSGISIPAHTALRVSLTDGIDSGHLKNGQTVHAKLVADVPLSKASAATAKRLVLHAGTPALLTVVGTVQAGKISAVGEISLQLLHVGATAVETDILTFRGKPGHRDLPDSAPEMGTNAGLHAGMVLVFHVQPSPEFGGPTRASKVSPGSVTAVVSGSKSSVDARQGPNRSSNPPSGAAGAGTETPGGVVPPAGNSGQPGGTTGQTAPAAATPTTPH